MVKNCKERRTTNSFSKEYFDEARAILKSEGKAALKVLGINKSPGIDGTSI